jgi:hypothetical protein
MKWTSALSAFWRSIPGHNLLGRRVSNLTYGAAVLGFVWLALLAFGYQARQNNGVLIPGVLAVEVSPDWRNYAICGVIFVLLLWFNHTITRSLEASGYYLVEDDRRVLPDDHFARPAIERDMERLWFERAWDKRYQPATGETIDLDSIPECEPVRLPWAVRGDVAEVSSSERG